MVALRKRQAKNFLCLLLLASGTPMLRAGDEFLHTQRGNNAYWEPLEFVVQEGRPTEWQRAVDTGQESPDDIREPGRGVPLSSLRYTAAPRSVVVLVRQRGSEPFTV